MRADYDVVNEYTGNGSLDSYSFDFKIQSLAQLLVLEFDDEGNELQRVRGTDTSFLSSVEFDALDGEGTVTLQDVLPNDYQLFLILDPHEPTQPYKFRGANSFNIRDIESALDNLGGAVQRNRYLIERTFKLNDQVDIDNFSMDLPPEMSSSPGAFLGINADGDGFALYTGIFDNDIPVSAFMETLLDDSDAETARTTLGFAGSGGTVQTANIEDGAVINTKATLTNYDFPGTEGIGLAGGATAERPASPALGDFRKNSDSARNEGYETSTALFPSATWVQYSLAFAAPGTAYNIGLVRTTTTTTNDSLKITGGNGSALSESNPGYICLRSQANPGRIKIFKVTSDVTINMDDAIWDSLGLALNEAEDQVFSVYAIDDGSASCKFGICPIPDKSTMMSAFCFSVRSSVDNINHCLVNSALSANGTCSEIGWFTAEWVPSTSTWAIAGVLNDATGLYLGKAPTDRPRKWSINTSWDGVGEPSWTATWWKKGKFIEGDIIGVTPGAPPVLTALILQLPDGITAVSTTADRKHLGEGVVFDNGTNTFVCVIQTASATQIKPRYITSADVLADVTGTAPMTWAINDRIDIRFKVLVSDDINWN